MTARADGDGAPHAAAFTLGTHLDEHDRPCAHHGPAAVENLLALATVGSRVSGFNHDIASKLQGLMMALDEIAELADLLDHATRDQLARATEGAQGSLREVLGILNTNRAMTKPAMRAPIALAELTSRAGERVYATLKCALPEVDINVSAPTAIHALSLVFDIAGGPGRGRTIPAEVTRTPTHVTLALPVTGPAPSTVSESLALASYVFARDGGSLRCADAGQRFVVSLPVA